MRVSFLFCIRHSLAIQSLLQKRRLQYSLFCLHTLSLPTRGSCNTVSFAKGTLSALLQDLCETETWHLRLEHEDFFSFWHKTLFCKRDMSFAAKEPYNQWLFCGNDLQLKASYESSPPMSLCNLARHLPKIDQVSLRSQLQRSLLQTERDVMCQVPRLLQDFCNMGWLRLVGSLKSYVSCAEYCLFYKALLQERPII